MQYTAARSKSNQGEDMKTDGTLIIFVLLIMAIVGVAFVLGNSNSITPVVAQGQMQMTLGHNTTSWINSVMSWIIKLALGGVFAGFGAALFNELCKAYSLWKRNAQAGHWQPGPNANWQRPSSTSRLSKQDMLLLALSGRLPQGERPSVQVSQEDRHEENELDIRL